jgi:predicted Zn-dependent protease
MKVYKKLAIILLSVVSLLTCETNPLTGESTMAFISDRELFAVSFQQYNQFLNENKGKVIKGTPEALMVARIGDNIRKASEKWLTSKGETKYLKDYRWEYNLVDSDEVNAWCMPGGKIVVYKGILPVTQNEDALATVMGHEVTHALLNHGKQRYSAAVLQELGAIGLSLTLASLGTDQQSQELFLTLFGVGSTIFGTLPFSREHESEADHYGLILMAIAGYNPEESVPFWQRMAALGGGTPEFLSTHPSPDTRIKDLRGWIPEAKKKADELNKK